MFFMLGTVLYVHEPILQAQGGTAESSGLGNLFNEKTEHLEESHSEFLKLWDRLIDLEAQELQVCRIHYP
jgi:DNA replication ATP-dependent helicase Dna2